MGYRYFLASFHPNEGEHNVSKSTGNEKLFVVGELKWWTWKRLLVVIVVIFIVLEIGTYAFNWTWTGFKAEGTLWNWLSLLLVPILVAALPICYSIHQSNINADSRQHEIG